MKLWHGILLIVGICIIAGGVFALNSGPKKVVEADTPPTYEATYTADQVIAVAKAQYPVAYKFTHDGLSPTRTLVETPTIIKVVYRGGFNRVWKVDIYCPLGYYLTDYSREKTVYFWETDGALHTNF